jgi:hypothetical protein
MPSTDQPIHYSVDHSVLDILVNDVTSRQTQPSSPALCRPQLFVLLDPFSRQILTMTLESNTVYPSHLPNDLQKEEAEPSER